MQPESLSILVTVFAYLVGVVARGLLAWWTKGRPSGPMRWWADLKAVAVLLVLAVTAGAYFLDLAGRLPQVLRLAALGLVLFYFGSR
jgi:hypothetical protein